MSDEAPVRIGIQKAGGHLFNTSRVLLRDWWEIKIPEKAGKKGHDCVEITVPGHGAGLLLLCRPKDLVDNVKNKMLDFALVSTDVLSAWEAAMICTSRTLILANVHDNPFCPKTVRHMYESIPNFASD